MALVLLILWGNMGISRAFAETPPPTAPRSFIEKPKLDPFMCQRFFIYRKKKLFCDSNLGMDAEKLRPIFQSSPEASQAVDELDLYQKNRRILRKTAYVGTVGLVIGLLSYALISKDRSVLRGGLTITGLGITGGSMIYGLSLSQTNESHLGNAVKIYNDKNPKDPIELQFSTGILF